VEFVEREIDTGLSRDGRHRAALRSGARRVLAELFLERGVGRPSNSLASGYSLRTQGSVERTKSFPRR